MFYTIYKTTNILTGKMYVGKHQTNDLNDLYMGSGKHLKRSITKYGIENFKKEILFTFDNECDMNAKEAELVTEDFCSREDTYNICVGGQGGFSYINNLNLNNSNKDKEKIYHIVSLKMKNRKNPDASERMKKRHLDGLIEYIGYSKGITLSNEHRSKISFSMKGKQKGSENSQYGTMWITNGTENKKIKKEVDIIPEGWYKGRK
jgi:dissimilatory sulfite reductase (desulfoviridin) alpha/beta subunit